MAGATGDAVIRTGGDRDTAGETAAVETKIREGEATGAAPGAA